MLYSTILPLCSPEPGLPGNLKVSLQSAAAFSQILRTTHLHLVPNALFPAPYNAIESNNHPPFLLDLSCLAGTGFPLGLEVLSKWGHFSSATQNYLVSLIHEQAVHLRQWPSTSVFPGGTKSAVTPILLKRSSWDSKVRHRAVPAATSGQHTCEDSQAKQCSFHSPARCAARLGGLAQKRSPVLEGAAARGCAQWHCSKHVTAKPWDNQTLHSSQISNNIRHLIVWISKIFLKKTPQHHLL